MTGRTFVPMVEQLEGRLMLTVVADVLPMIAANPAMVEAASMAMYDEARTYVDVTVHSEDSPTGHVLVVQLKNSDQPRTIGILGGEQAQTSADGTVRLRPPAHVRSLELTISDASGRPYSFLRIELDGAGHLLSQSPMMLGALSAGGHNAFHGTNDQLIRLHSGGAHDMANLSSGSGASVPMSGSHAMDTSSFDEVLTHYGMPSMPMMPQYDSGSSHAAMNQPEAASTENEVADAESATEHSSEMSDRSPIQLATAMTESMDDAAVDEEYADVPVEESDVVDEAFVAWQRETTSDSHGLVEFLKTDPRLDAVVPHEVQRPQGPPLDKVYPVLHTIAAGATDIDLPAATPVADSQGTDESSYLPSTVGCTLAIALAAGVIILERRAQAQQKKPTACQP